MSIYVFFLQVEDGIRDLVRSRGLGDVYKRQEDTCLHRHQIDSILPSPFSFISIPGVVYYLKINISRKKEDQNIVFSLSCAESPENFIKEKAILIECDDYSLCLLYTSDAADERLV